MKSVISSRGQITIPVAVQRALGWRPGTQVEFELQPGAALLRRRPTAERAVDRAYGILRGQGRTDEIVRELRGPGLAGGRRLSRGHSPD